MKKKFFIFALAVLFVSCKSEVKQNNQEKTSAEIATKSEKPKYEPPAVPAVISAQEDVAAYAVLHFWDNFNFVDTAAYNESNEQIFANFLAGFNYIDLNTAREGIAKMIQKAETADSSAYIRFVDICEKYFYNANSPYCSDELYILVLQNIIETKWLDDDCKIVPKYRLNLALKNRVGESANDFAYTLANNKSAQMYDVDTEFTLLFFNNPGCDACKEYAEQLKQSQTIQHLLNDKRLTILAIYTDENLDEWNKYQIEIPETWINAYDKNVVIHNSELYDLKAIPTLYLLDKNKKVLLKDAFVKAVDIYLSGV